MKKFVSVILALSVAALTLSGCAPKTTSTKVSNAKVKLEFMNQKEEANDTFAKLITEFEAENPNITIEQNNPPDGAQVLASRASTGDLPDLFTNWPQLSDFKNYVKDDFIMDLTNDSALNNVKPNILNMEKINGKVYSLPLGLNTIGVFYNIKMFKELGLTVPKTWNDFIATLNKAKAAGKTAILLPDKDSFTINQFLDSTTATDVPNAIPFFTDVLNGKTHLMDNPDIAIIAQKALELRNYGEPDSLGLSYDDATREFANGQGVMFYQGIWDIASIKKANPSLDFGMFPLPADNAANTKIAIGIDSAVCISAKTKYPVQAKKFIEFLSRTKTAQEFADMDQSPSSIKGVIPKLKEDKGLTDMISQEKAVTWLSTIQTTAQTDWGTTQQNFILKKDVNAYIKQSDALWYGKANK